MVFRVGLIGYGYWGSKVAQAVGSCGEIELAAIADWKATHREAARGSHPSVALFCNHTDLLDNDNIDAIWVATPACSHFAVAVEALKKRKHVLVEKPFATNSQDAAEMIKMAEELDCILMAGHTFLYDASIRTLQKLLMEETIGRVLYIDSHRTGLGIFRADVDVTWDLAFHDVYISRYLLGADPISVRAWGSAHVCSSVIDVATLSFLFPKGVRVNVRVSWLEAAKCRKIIIVGTQGMILLDKARSDRVIEVYRTSRALLSTAYSSDLSQGDNYATVQKKSYSVAAKQSLVMESTHFARCAQKRTRPLSDGSDGLYVVRVLEATAVSLANHGQEVWIND